jgi:WhiB family redox-sensing transcriptional regulator
MSWYHYAACRGQDPEMFFPVGVSELAERQLQQAKAVCAGCAVRSLCLEFAILAGVEHGVWGGLGEDERRATKRRIRRRHPPRVPQTLTL